MSVDYAVNADLDISDDTRQLLIGNFSETGGEVMGFLTHGSASNEYEENFDPGIEKTKKATEYVAVTLADVATLKAPILSTAAANAASDANDFFYSDAEEKNEREASAAAEDEIISGEDAAAHFYRNATENIAEEGGHSKDTARAWGNAAAIDAKARQRCENHHVTRCFQNRHNERRGVTTRLEIERYRGGCRDVASEGQTAHTGEHVKLASLWVVHRSVPSWEGLAVSSWERAKASA